MDQIYEPERAEDISQARYYEGTDIELINKWPDDIKVTHAIFDHDGTISTLREGWENIMAPMMVRAILGDSYDIADKPLYNQVKSRVDELIDRTTGIQTLAQMAALTELVKDFGIVPRDQILDMHGYKKIYNDELLKLVRSRENRFRSGELSVEDLTIRNSVLLLERLYSAGVKLYLASGTDQDDVKHEAELLGYDKYFEGGIYGSVGDIKKEVKRMVLESILNTIGGASNRQIITFGDGPVEIRETRKRGGLTVGIASNEIERSGLNASKRTRLIRAGADIIIPDFAQLDQILGVLKINRSHYVHPSI